MTHANARLTPRGRPLIFDRYELLGRSARRIEILADIGRVVVEALTPLCESILAEPTNHTLMHLIGLLRGTLDDGLPCEGMKVSPVNMKCTTC